MSMGVRPLIAALLVAALFVAACTSKPVSPAKTVPAQLEFTAKTLDGQDFSGQSLLGKPAVLWFWAPWCPVCQREAPMVGQVAAAHPGVTFVGVAALDQLPAMRQFVDKYPVKGFTQLADTDGKVWAKFGVTHQPAYAFIGGDGSVDVVKGSLAEPDLTQRVTALAKP
jgi:thiol-disulfide isomerase/thioredoxin